MSDEREDVAEKLRRVREEARGQARPAGTRDPSPAVPPEPPPDGDPQPAPREMAEPVEPPLEAPDATAVNAAWRAEGEPPRGLTGLLYRLLDRILRPRFEAQRTFNARQVELDNQALSHLDARLAATHRHYDRLLGLLGRRLDEADARHVILERELVGHVQDLVRRIDLVLEDGNRGRLAIEFALEDVRARLLRLEEALRRRE